MVRGPEKSEVCNTKKRIMDAAEILFAERGFERTTTHLLTSMAGVNQAAVNYHFGSKDKLIEEVIMRRLSPISRQSLTSLQRIEAEADRTSLRPKTEDVLLAIIDPFFKISSASSSESFFLAIVGRALVEQDKTIQSIYRNCYKPVLNMIFNMLKKSMPEFPEQILHLRIHFALGTITYAMNLFKRKRLLEDFSTPPYGEEDVLQGLIRFVVSGMESIETVDRQNRC